MLRTLRDALIAIIVERSVNAYAPSYLPYAWLVIVAWLMWDFLRIRPVKQRIIDAYSKRPKNLVASYIIVFIAGGTLLCLFWWGIGKVVSLTTTTAAISRHPCNFTPQQIYDRISRAGWFQRDEVAKQFVGCEVDWQLSFTSAEKIRDNPGQITVNFNPETWVPPIITLQTSLEGHEYLGDMQSGTFMFQVNGVIREVIGGRINLVDASIKQLPLASPPHSPVPTPSPPIPTVTTSPTSVGDLRMSVISFKYQSQTKELVAKVEFVNNDSRRRTVLGAVFFYRSKGEGDDLQHLLAKSNDEMYGDGDPVYVEPNQPIVVPYKLKLTDIRPTTMPGTAFGLVVTTLRKDGGLNTTSVEAMIVSTGFNEDIAWVSSGQRNVSLDEMFKNVRMHDPTVTFPDRSPTPPLQSTPTSTSTPSSVATQKSQGISIADGIPIDLLAKSSIAKSRAESVLDKIYTDKTAHELLLLFKDRTHLQAVELIQPYMGQWITVKGKIVELYSGAEGVTAVLRTERQEDVINCPFEQRWREALRHYKAGDSISVHGKIAGHQNGKQLYLLECELH